MLVNAKFKLLLSKLSCLKDKSKIYDWKSIKREKYTGRKIITLNKIMQISRHVVRWQEFTWNNYELLLP